MWNGAGKVEDLTRIIFIEKIEGISLILIN